MKKRIVVVDDVVDTRDILRTVLEYAGYDVNEASDGKTGLKLISDTLPDLVLLDLSIPEMSGWDVAKRLKLQKATRNIPVIALTAHAMPGDETKALQSGCDAYLSKPIKPMIILKTIEDILSKYA